jgi:hypothetical protein
MRLGLGVSRKKKREGMLANNHCDSSPFVPDGQGIRRRKWMTIC